MASECLFCRIMAGEIPSERVYQDEELYAFRDINPVAPTHILVIPRKHITSLAEAGDEDEALLGRMMLCGRRLAAEEGLNDEGYRCVINTGEHGGQSVFHIHLHVLGGRGFSWPPG